MLGKIRRRRKAILGDLLPSQTALVDWLRFGPNLVQLRKDGRHTCHRWRGRDAALSTPGGTVLSKIQMLDTLLKKTASDIKLKRNLLRYVDGKVEKPGLPWLVLNVRRASSRS